MLRCVPCAPRSTGRAPESSPFSRGFTLVELLVVIGIIAVLISILLPSLSAARQAAVSVQCLSNLRQLSSACMLYVNDNKGYCLPAAADEYWTGANLLRWHGSRPTTTVAFDFNHDPSPLKRYLTDSIKACPALATYDMPAGFEAGCGGYGYNMMHIGSIIGYTGQYGPTQYQTPSKLVQIKRSAQKVLFADTAYFDPTLGLIEYSFAEAPLFPGGWNAAPSVHFRHRSRANVAWADGHGTSEGMDWSLAATDPGNYAGIDYAKHNLGWFGPKDNTLFQRD